MFLIPGTLIHSQRFDTHTHCLSGKKTAKSSQSKVDYKKMSDHDVEWQSSLTDTGIIQQSGPEQYPSEQTQSGQPCHLQYRLPPKSTAKPCKCDWVQADPVWWFRAGNVHKPSPPPRILCLQNH